MELRLLIFVALLAITVFGSACGEESIGGLDDRGSSRDAFNAGDGGVDLSDRTDGEPSQEPDETRRVDEPPPPGESDEAPPPQDSYAFRDDFNGTEVDSSVWQVATWIEHGGQTGPERCYVEDGHLKMIFINDSTQGYLSSAIESREEFYYGRWEARLKPSNVPGVLNSMYTIDWDDTADDSSSSDGTKQEIDIEFLTYSFTGDDGRVHFALHASGLPSADTRPDILLGFDPSADFHVWGFDITPDKIEWFVDDQVLWTYDYGANPITIDAPYMIKFNAWSNTGWVNGPPAADTESVYLIDWVRFTPYTT